MVRKMSPARRCTGGSAERIPEPDPPEPSTPQDSSGYSSTEDEDTDLEGPSDDELDQLASKVLVDIHTQMGEDDEDEEEENEDSDCEGSETQAGHSGIAEQCSSASFMIDKTPGVSRSLDVAGNSSSESEDQNPEDSEQESDSSSVVEQKHKKSSKDKVKKPKKTRNKNIENQGFTLATSLDCGLDPNDVYVSSDLYTQPQNMKKPIQLENSQTQQLLQKSLPVDAIPQCETSLRQIKKQRRMERDKSKGKGWFDLPAQELTEEKKNDLLVLQMRRALDPKRFYKGPDMKGLPKYFQVGHVVDNPSDFYSSRIPKKQRKSTLVDELLADAEFRKFNKRKYAEIMETKRTGHRGAQKHMKRLKKNKK